MILNIVFSRIYARISYVIKRYAVLDALNFEEDFEMKKRNVVTLLAVAAVVGMVAVGCGSKDAETEAPAATTEATTEATTDAPAEGAPRPSPAGGLGSVGWRACPAGRGPWT